MLSLNNGLKPQSSQFNLMYFTRKVDDWSVLNILGSTSKINVTIRTSPNIFEIPTKRSTREEI
jgi:hypothetical protein